MSKQTTHTEPVAHSKLVETARLVKDAIEEKEEAQRQLIAAREKVDQERAALITKVVPMADVKQFLMDYIEAKRTEYLGSLRDTIENALYPLRGKAISKDVAKPLNFDEMEKMLTPGGERSITDRGGVLQLLQPNKLYFDDLAFYFYFGDVIQKVIAENFDGLNFTYRNVHSDEMGKDRAAIRVELATLDEKKAALTTDIHRLQREIKELGGSGHPSLTWEKL